MGGVPPIYCGLQSFTRDTIKYKEILLGIGEGAQRPADECLPISNSRPTTHRCGLFSLNELSAISGTNRSNSLDNNDAEIRVVGAAKLK